MLRKNTNKEELIATFSHLENVQIGKNNFTDKDLEDYFGAMGSINNSNKLATILLKQVFQKEYPITRLPNDKSLPRVPVKAEEKLKLIECLTRYFNHLRTKIIKKKYKTGDSASLREMLSELQSIKVLIEHFKETKETFPYHMFADYLTNADFINLKGDIASQMRGLERNKVQDERIRNLLRQFTVTYLKNKNSRRFVLNDPGISESEYNNKEDDIGILPSILENLLDFINDKQATFKNNESYDVDISSYLQEMRDNINELKERGKSVTVPSGGGSDTINELEEINKSYNELFDSMYSKYIELLAKYNDSKTSGDCQKDVEAIQNELEEANAKIANSENRINKLNDQKINLRSRIQELRGTIAEKNELNSSLNSELNLLRTELATTQATLATATSEYEANLAVKKSTEDVLRRTEEEAKITAALEKARGDFNNELASKLQEERERIQATADLALTKLQNEKEATYQEILSTTQSQIDTYTQSIAEKDSEIKAAQTRAEQRETTIASLKNILNRYNNKAVNQEELVAGLTRDLTAATTTLNDATAKAASDASNAEINLKAAQEETRKANAELEKLQKSFDGAQKLQEERLVTVNNLTTEKAAVMEELDKVKKEAQLAQLKAAAEVAEQNKSHAEELARIAEETAQREKSINDKNIIELNTFRNEISRLNTTVEQIQQKGRIATELLSVIHKNELQRLNLTIESLNATISALNETNDKRVEELNVRIADLEGEGARGIQNLQAAKAELAATKASIDELNPKYEQLQITYKNVQEKLEACEGSLAEKTQKTTRLEGEISRLEREVGSRQSLLEAAIERERASATKSESEINAAKREVAKARQKLAEAEQATRIFKEESERKDNQIEQVRRENKKVVSERDKANEKELASRRSAAEAKQRETQAIAEVARLTALESAARTKEEEAKAATRAALASVSEAEGRASQASTERNAAEGRASQASTERNAALTERNAALATASEAQARARAQEEVAAAVRAEKDAAVKLANENVKAAEAARRAAEDKTRESQQAAKEAEAKVIIAKKEKREADNRLSQARDQLKFAEERADLAEQSASESQTREKRMLTRAIESEKGRRAAVLSQGEAEERASQASTDRNAALATASEAEARARAQEEVAAAVRAEKDAAIDLANEKAEAAEAARRAAEDKTRESQEEAKEAKKRVTLAEQAKREADNRLSQARDQLKFTNERADLAEQRADKSDQRVKKYVTRAIQSEKGRIEAEVAMSRAIEAQQTAVEARSAAESARDDAIQRAETAERTAQNALQEAQASKIRQQKLVEINSRIGGLEEEVETLRLGISVLDERILQANDEIKAQQQHIRELKKNKKTIFGAIQEGFDTYFGEGGKNDTLLEYCNKVANDSLNTFLLEEPLPFFSLIKDFENGSKMDILKTTNEEYILKQFIQYHLEEHFNSKEMKEFYFHAKEIFAKQDYSEYAKMFFVLNEIINVIRSSKEDIDVVRIKSKEYNSSFDYLEYILQDYEYDFYTIAKKKFLLDDNHIKPFDLTFIKENIFISVNKGSKTYEFNKNLTLTRKDFDFKSDIYYISSHMIYLFFILSTHFYLQSENMIDTDEYFTVSNNLEKTARKLKRTKNKEKKSIAKLFKERKEFKLDG